MNTLDSLENVWQTLVAAAVLGTGRQIPILPAVNQTGAEDFGRQLQTRLTEIDQLADLEPEARLLRYAALLAIPRKAGQKASQRHPSLASAPTDDLPLASALAQQYLVTMLNGSHTALLPEWLTLAAERNLRVSAELLPDLLAIGATRSALIEPIRRVIGRRGEWLAALNPPWRYAMAVEGNDQEVWQTGISEARLQVLKNLRQSDPDQARQLVTNSWASEPAQLRPKILATFAINLNREDENFLESALDDRRKEVREEAVALLRKLPTSQLQERMTQRLLPLLKLRGLLRKSIDVSLPTACTVAMQRDSIQEKLPTHLDKMGERAWWLRQMLAITPTQLWLDQFKMSAPRLIDAATRSEWSDLLLDGWLDAAILHEELAMTVALADHFANSNPARLLRILDALPVAYVEQHALPLLRQHNVILQSQDTLLFLLSNHRRPWSDELSQLFVQALQRTLQQPFNFQSFGWISSQLAQIAQHISPMLTEKNAANLSTTREDWAIMNRAIDEFVAIAQFRQAMRRALVSPPTPSPEICFTVS